MRNSAQYLPLSFALLFLTACTSSAGTSGTGSIAPTDVASSTSTELAKGPTNSSSPAQPGGAVRGGSSELATDQGAPPTISQGAVGSQLHGPVTMTPQLQRDFCTNRMPVAALSQAYGSPLNYLEPETVAEETQAGSLRCPYLTPDGQHFIEVGFAADADAESSFAYYTKSGSPPLRVPGFSVEAYRVLVPGEKVEEPLHLVLVPHGNLWYEVRIAKYAGGHSSTPEGTFSQYSGLARVLIDASPHPPNLPE